MSRVNPDELPAQMAVLGLVIRRPGQTVTQYGEQLEIKFGQARFSRSTAHVTLPRLASDKRGCVHRTHVGPGRERAQDRYAPTDQGHEVFREWMHGKPPIGQPVLREATHGRIALCRPEDLPRMIEMARTEANVSMKRFEEGTERVRQNARARRPSANDPRELLEADIKRVLLHVDPGHWYARAMRYQQTANRLEDILEDARAAGLIASGE